MPSSFHKDSDEYNKHTAKGFDNGVTGSYPIKDELGTQTFTPMGTLPNALDFLDGNAAPPVSPTTGDIYVLVDEGNGAIHVDYTVGPGAAYNDWVRWSGFFWVPITPIEGQICYDETANKHKKFNGTTWEDLVTAAITGSGTADYVTRWTGSTALGDSIIRDNGTTIGVNTAPQVNSLISTTSNKNITLDTNNSKTTGNPAVISAVMNGGATTTTSKAIDVLVGGTTGIAYGVYSDYLSGTGGVPDSSIMNAGDGAAGYFKAHATTGIVYGLVGIAAPSSPVVGVDNVAGRFYAANGDSNYALQLEDGTEGIGKVLTCVTADGKAEWQTPSGVSDGDKGDVTVSSSGTVWTIDNDAVTFAKMQNIAAQKILGRETGGSGNIEELAISGDLQILLGVFGLNTTPMYISDMTTVNLLDNTANWTAGNYTGAAITGTYQGQKHYNSTYFFECVHDNIWIRILRS